MGDEESQTSTAVDGTASNTQDDSLPVHTHGYHRLANFMGEYPEYGIYRRFGSLNSLNLLYLQAELVMLELLLQQYAAEDGSSNDPLRALFAKNWMLLSNQRGANTRCKKQWTLVLRIRKVLRQYSISYDCSPSNAESSRQ